MRIQSEGCSPTSGIQADDQQMIAEWIGLRVGRKMEIVRKVKNFAGDLVPRKRTGEVVSINKFFFTCKMDNGARESFRHNQLLNKEGGQTIKLKGE